ncbi:MAG: peptidylprolyl isomerase [archaeon]|nr:peptidylprolyl isomerase [archaeon]MDD2478023.1 peptidylprolyl isomerase [Candidatus ainarchaeum sp.]MDD3084792.1 peptidylprolyl isomerase [Candidatus ainarchaeum sp.]MDD4221352.1 peptidylprolyl isomerase [Candidatus ainarchaeum sp.]MDD4662647.1 peptidylprolyl isomerase [Candidatus ainarchaeum sp.]
MNPIVIIKTSKGNIEVELFKDKAPKTVSNFLQYVEGGFYKNTVFHRVMKGFMVQGGGFLENGEQKDTFSPISLETTKDTNLSNLTGTLAMARTNDPNSATSQFFINTVDNFFLDYSSEVNPGYAVFGKVLSGMEVVKDIEDVKTTTKFKYHQDWPVEDVVILDVVIKK